MEVNLHASMFSPMHMHNVNFTQDHRLEMSRLSTDNTDVSYLREMLETKDNELRQIQRNLAKWKDDMAGKLTSKFDEELLRRVKM